MVKKTLLRIGTWLLIGMLALSLLPALAEGESLGTLRVCNCEEWVSLRKKPKTSSDRLVKVPLGALVTDCVRENDEFIYCTYEGKNGYILAEYLEKPSAEEMQALSRESGSVLIPEEQEALIVVEELPVQTETEEAIPVSQLCRKEYLELMSSGGECLLLESREVGEERVTLCAVRDRSAQGETLTVAVYDPNLGYLWARQMTDRNDGQFEPLQTFVGGTKEEPRLMLYDAKAGLQAVDLLTGDEVWTLSAKDVHLGSGICWAVEKDGTMYIAGADGPHPVAVSERGTVLWYSDPGNNEVYGPYSIQLLPEGVFTQYESGPDNGSRGHYAVLYSYFGETLKADLIR